MTRILVVDDCAVDRAQAGWILTREADWTVEFATSGDDALRQMTKVLPDLVLTDLQMPNLDGLQLVSEVRVKYPHVPIILMTAQGSEDIAFKALHAGAASYVPKAMLPDHLRDTVKRVLQVSTQSSSLRKALQCLSKSDSAFSLANDSALIAPLVARFQEECLALGICNQADQVRIGVALGEALANALYHGNLELSSELRETDADAYFALAESRRRQSPYQDRRITVKAELASGKAVFVIRDEGPGFDPTSLPDPTDPANLEKVSGRGILLMQAFMDHVDYNPAGNEVTMIKESKAGG